MVHGAVRTLFQLIGALFVGLLIAVPLFALRLSSGPIALDFLTPYIEQALAARDGTLVIHLDTTMLAAGSGDRMLEIRALNVRAHMAGTDAPIAVIPEMAMNLSGRALMVGVIAPNSIRLNAPKVRLIREASGALQWGIGPSEGEPAPGAGTIIAGLKDALLGAPDPNKPGRVLQSFAISNADILVEDRALGTSWHAPGAYISVRRAPIGVTATARLPLDLAGETGEVSISAAYSKSDGAVEGDIRLEGLRPAALARLGGPLSGLSMIDLPLGGSIRGRIDGTGVVESLAFDITGGGGSLRLPAPFSEPQKIAALSLKGKVDQAMTRLEQAELKIDLGGPTLSLTASAEGLGGPTSVKAEGSIHDVPVDSVRDLWPNGLAQNARDWVIPNLTKGRVREAKIALTAHSASGRFDDVILDHLSGEVHPEGVTVDYLRPMPVARNAAAVCTFDASSFKIALKAGEIFGLKLKEGTIVFTGLDKEDQFADIELVIAGPATDALRLIDSPPLRYAQALGIDPSRVGGDAAAKVRLKFPLLKSLRLDDVGIKAQATIKGVKIPKVMMGLDLGDGTLDLDVDAKGLDAAGPVVLAGIPATLTWRENFSLKGTTFRSRYQLKMPVVDEDQRKQFGLDGPPFVSPFVSGPVAADVTATFLDGGKGDIAVKADLATARMELPGLGWVKEPGKPATADAAILLDHKLIAAVPHFLVSGSGLEARGAVSFDGDGAARQVEFQRLAYGGKTDVEGSITLRPGHGGLDIIFKGASFNAEPTLARDDAQKRGEASTTTLPPMTVTGSFKTLWLSEKGSLSNAVVNLQRNTADWQHLTLKGNLPHAKSFIAHLQPGAPKRRTFSVTSDDAGATLRAFDIYEHLSGGELEVEGYVDDAAKAQPFIGTAKISDYHVRNAPTLARLLTVAALTGVVDILQGEGVGFSSLEAPFTLADGLLEVRDGRAWGAALGLTAKGQIDLDHARLALEGTVVPAYVFNSVLGKIPLLGWLITGGEKGSGVIAVNYSMKGPTSDPSVMVNPLSALTPGFLRNLFNIFDDGSATTARKPIPSPP
ncbi:conserved hypothetical protein [Candidatus Terasakiella magnetica]|nr:conserved hypothetical protein [Candidatus Terasakiella magnetica]